MTAASSAAVLAERLRKAVERMPFTAELAAFSMTISIGIAELDPKHDTLEQLIAHADSALYQAKAGGRNRAEIWHAP
jgi:diguanylate cyclase (GGDEF)-like protein